MHTISAMSHFTLWLVGLNMLSVLAFTFSRSYEFHNFFSQADNKNITDL